MSGPRWQMPDTAPLHRLVRRTRRLIRAGSVTAGLVLATGLIAWVVLAGGLVDLALALPPAGRAAAFALAVAVGLWACSAVIWPLVRPLPDAEVVRRVEAHLPGIEGRLVTCLDLEARGRASSPAFFARLVTEAGERTRGFRARRVVGLRRLRALAVFALAALVAFHAAGLLLGERLGVAVTRIVAPWADVPPASGVRYSITTPGPETRVLRGDDVAFAVDVDEGEPESLELELTGAGGARLRYDLARRGLRRWEAVLNSGGLGGAFEPEFTFRVRGAGTWTRERRVVIVDRPAVASVQVRVRNPEYMGVPDPPARAGLVDITGPEGGRVEVDVAGEGEIGEGEIQILEARPRSPAGALLAAEEVLVPAQTFALADRGGGQWSGSFPLTGLGLYRVELRDGAKHANKPVKEARYEALPDAPPQVSLERPAGEVTLGAACVLPLSATAADDYGLAELGVFYRRGEAGPWLPAVRQSYDRPRLVDRLDAGWDLGPLGLGSGERLWVRAEARDRKGQAARSREVSVSLTPGVATAERRLADAGGREQAARRDLDEVIARQTKVTESVHTSEWVYGRGHKVAGVAAEGMREEFWRQAGLQRQNAELARRVAASLADSARATAESPLMPRAVADEAKALAETLSKRMAAPMDELADEFERRSKSHEPDADWASLRGKADGLQHELEELRRRVTALAAARTAARSRLDEALARAAEERLRREGEEAAGSLEAQRDRAAALRKELEEHRRRQEALREQTARTAEVSVGEREREQAGVEEQQDETLRQSRELQERSPPASQSAPRRQQKTAPSPGAEAKGRSDPKGAGQKSSQAARGSAKGPQTSGRGNPSQPAGGKGGRPGENGGGRRSGLLARQAQRLDQLAAASAAMAAAERAASQMAGQIRQALPGSQAGQPTGRQLASGDSGANALATLLRSAPVRRALARAARQAGAAAGAESAGAPAGAPGPGEATGLEALEPRVRAAVLRLPARQRQELLEGLRGEVPEGYGRLVEDYFRRLGDAPPARGKGP